MNSIKHDFYGQIKEEFRKIVDKNNFWDKEVGCDIVAKGFFQKRPKIIAKGWHYLKMPSKEYALIKGKEIILRCKFEKSYGDAFTDEPKIFRGKLSKIFDMDLGKTTERAVFFSISNAVYSSLGLVQSIHCKESKPEICGKKLASFIAENFGKDVVVAHIGYQPGHVEACSKVFRSYVTDMNPTNIGRVKFGIKILSGKKNRDVIKKSDVASITGSTIANGTLPQLLEWCERYDTEPIVYGVTVGAAAKILGLRHFCPYARKRP